MQFEDLTSGGLRLDDGGKRGVVLGLVVGLVGLAASVILARGIEGGRALFFQAYLTSFMFVLSLALGGLFFVLITYLTRAGWSIALRRMAENFAWCVLPLGVLSLVVLYGIHDLYHWSHADAVAHDPLLQHKAVWLNTTFFSIRVIAYFVIWGIMATFFLRRSLAQDKSGDPRITLQLERVAAPAMIVFALTVTFAAFDLLMSLDPHWYSTIFGVYYFAGCTLGIFSLMALWTHILRSRGRLTQTITPEHFHDLGKLMFAFVVFWAYIAFSQYFLIWYGNIPEETAWYKVRQTGPWLSLSLVLLFGHFILPFMMLMSRHPKRSGAPLVIAAVWLLAMHWCDLFYIVAPTTRPDGPGFSPIDLTCLLGLGGLFFAFASWRMGRSDLVPVKDPRLGESLGFENA